MHELSIALSIVELATHEVAKHNASNVGAITLEIGKLAGVETDALQFVWPSVVKNTVLENAAWEINHVNGQAFCATCKQSFRVNTLYSLCSNCNQPFNEIEKGDKLFIKSLTLNT